MPVAPTLDPTIFVLAGALILAISFVFAMLGLGGGMLYVPLLKWLGFPLSTVAIPLGLLLNGLNTLLAFLRYWREGLVDFRGGAPAALAALVFAPLGAWCLGLLPQDLVLGLFAAAVLVAGVRSLISREAQEPSAPLPPGRRLLVGMAAGGFAGFSGGLLGLGGGFILAPVLMELGYGTKQAAATTAFIVTFSSFSGFLGHLTEGRIEPILTVVAVSMVVLGSQAGAWFMVRKAKPTWVKRVYGLVLLAVAVQLLLGIAGSRS